ncbi:hypothetical protein [Afipia felis]
MAVDAWALGRLGVGEPISIPILDSIPLTRALDTIGRIGALDLMGYQERWVAPHDCGLTEADVRARGLRVLRDGKLDAVLDKVFDEFHSSGSRKKMTIHNAYGWFAYWFTLMGG